MNKCFIVFALLLFTGCKSNSPFNVGDCLVHDGASLLSIQTTFVFRVKEVGGIHRDEFTLSYKRWYAWDYWTTNGWKDFGSSSVRESWYEKIKCPQ
jgi:hypothetical protein